MPKSNTDHPPASAQLTDLVWDCHACLPLDPNTTLDFLHDHIIGGTHVLSINVGMDMNTVPQIMRVIAGFTDKINAEPDRYMLVSTLADIEAARQENRLALYFDLEGSVMLQDMPEMIPIFHKLGVRQIHFAYNRSNSVSGGCHDTDNGLTPLGKRMVAAVNQSGMLMDCSHMGKRSSLDVMAVSTKPVVFSHTNPHALCDHARCIDDEQIKACAAQKGVIGLSGFSRFIGSDGEPTPQQMADHVDYIAQLVGIDHVGLGLDSMYSQAGCTDFPDGVDRSYWWPRTYGYGQGGISAPVVFSPLRFPDLATELEKRGYTAADRAKVFGQNFLRVAQATWV